MEVAESGLGPGGVDLTHVLALIAPLHVPDKYIFSLIFQPFVCILPDMQIPHAVTIVTDPDPGVPRDHVVLNSEDRTPVIVDPGNLRRNVHINSPP